MEPFVKVTGIAAPLPIDNVDTDAIIPSRETQSVARTGYGEKLFANWRYEPSTRIVNPDFVLNKAPFDRAVILISGANFGCGSSREAAVWALKQFGIRAVIAESYGSIFYNNCMRNGLLPVTLSADEIQDLLAYVEECNGASSVVVDLEKCQVLAGDKCFNFELAQADREILLTGADEIKMTLQRRNDIEAFREQDKALRPWLHRDSCA